VALGYDGVRAAYERFLLTNFPADSGLQRNELELGGVKAISLSETTGTDPTILHFHGGGYVVGSAHSSEEYAGRLAKALGGRCITVDYRLAPENPYPAALDDALSAYRGLLSTGVHPSRVLLSGESSGAGLALALAMLIRSAGDPAPAGIIAICPFADLTLSGASVKEFDGRDAAANRDLLTFWGASYFQRHEPRDPLVSPVFGDFRGLPPIFISATNGEVLYSDSIRIAQGASAAGVHVTSRNVEDSVHVFVLFPFLPEAMSTLGEITTWASRLKQTSAVHQTS
jgi:salicylate hydroxylase